MNYGSDPEFFLSYEEPEIDKEHDDKLPYALPPVLAEELGLQSIGGDDKHPIYFENDQFRLIGDGAALEVNLKQPYENPMSMVQIVRDAKDTASELARKLGLSLSVVSEINFDYKKYVKPEWFENERLLYGIIFGCDQDFDAMENFDSGSTVIDASIHPFRYGGGHLHFSGMTEFERFPLQAIRLLAITLGNWLLVKNFEVEKHRLYYYGKPGKYRVQKYPDGSTGIEYRSPSNQWLNYSDEELKEMFSVADKSFYLLSHPKEGSDILDRFLMRTVRAFDTKNIKESKRILEKVL